MALPSNTDLEFACAENTFVTSTVSYLTLDEGEKVLSDCIFGTMSRV